MKSHTIEEKIYFLNVKYILNTIFLPLMTHMYWNHPITSATSIFIYASSAVCNEELDRIEDKKAALNSKLKGLTFPMSLL